MSDSTAATRNAPAKPSAPADSQNEGNIKETIEQILIAFILAFIFRAFVVEAFVIPTGSMAPTLMGAHMRFRCEDCGYEWTVNYSSPGDGDDLFIPKRASDYLRDRLKVFSLRCPNCGFRVPRINSNDNNNQATDPPVCYGDRILVLKYLYLFQDPQRWDVVVFKAPAEPQRWDYSQNYIKRLVGKPGETIMILDGDIYVAQTQGRQLAPGDFQIQTKPHAAQEALWRIVYDNDYYPQQIDRAVTDRDSRVRGHDNNWRQPWSPAAGESGWNLGAGPLNGRVFRFDNASASAAIDFDPNANPDQQSLTDWLAYDVTVLQGPNMVDTYDDPRVEYKADDNVSDVKLAFFYQRKSGDGPIRAELTKLDRTFIAEITPEKVSLLQRPKNGGETLLESVPMRNVGASRPARIEFQNVDYQVTLRVDGKEVVKTTAEQYGPDVANLLERFRHNDKPEKAKVRLTAARQACEISHLSLWRDVYYMNRRPGFDPARGMPLRWGTPDNFPNGLITLAPDEYFVCGDNSPISGDARYWEDPINLPLEDLKVESGRVPGRFLLGKAFFVYWPAGFRPVDNAPALVPNFGQMRFIH